MEITLNKMCPFLGHTMFFYQTQLGMEQQVSFMPCQKEKCMFFDEEKGCLILNYLKGVKDVA
ncbi:MAG: hypothetical protein QXO40_00105 [Candidatus Aenigmatarchaeota archaeon]